MENKTIEQIQNEVLELTQKIESVKNNLTELQNKESQTPQIDFGTFIESLLLCYQLAVAKLFR